MSDDRNTTDYVRLLETENEAQSAELATLAKKFVDMETYAKFKEDELARVKALYGELEAWF